MEKIKIIDFLKENKEHFAAVGVLGVMIAFMFSLPKTIISYTLSFLMLSALVIIWSDVNFRLSSEDSPRVTLLKMLLWVSFWLIILFALLSFRLISWIVLKIPIFVGLLYIGIILLKKTDWLKKITSDNYFQKTLGGTLFLLMIIVAFVLTSPISNVVNNLLDQVDHIKSAFPLY